MLREGAETGDMGFRFGGFAVQMTEVEGRDVMGRRCHTFYGGFSGRAICQMHNGANRHSMMYEG